MTLFLIVTQNWPAWVTVAVQILICAAAGLVCGKAVVWLYARIPDSWLCEAGQEDFKETALAPPAACALIRSSGKKAGTACALAVFADLMYAWHAMIPVPAAVLTALAVTALATAAQSDADFMIIPDQFCAFILVAGVMAAGFEESSFHKGIRSAAESLAAAGAGFAAMFVAALLACWMKKDSDALGMGDVKLIAACGALSGPEGIFPLIFIASASSALYMSVCIITRRAGAADPKPMAPWIFLAAVICLPLRFELIV